MTKTRWMAKTMLASTMLAGALLAGQVVAEPLHKVFVFGSSAKASAGATAIKAADAYTPATGYGFENSTPVFEDKSVTGAPFTAQRTSDGVYRFTNRSAPRWK